MHSRRLGLLMVAAALASGCSDHPAHDAQSGRSIPVEQLHPPFSFVWSAQPRTELFSRPAELVRATREALELTNIYGPDKTFPGYLPAMGSPRSPGDREYQLNITQSRSGYVEVGKSPRTNYLHIAELTVSPDRNAISAVVCGYSIAAPENTTELNPDLVQDARRIDLSGPASDTQPTSLVDDHSDRVDPRGEMPPTWNVFGSWHITKLASMMPDLPASCGDWWQSQLPYLRRPPGENYLTRPADDPNFQMPREPVRPQFPEWIKADQM